MQTGTYQRDISSYMNEICVYEQQMEGYFNRIYGDASCRAAMGQFDLHKDAERLFGEILSIVLGYRLIDLNIEKYNHPAVDFGNREMKVAVQITTTVSNEKIKGTLEKFIRHELDREYNHIIVMVIAPKAEGLTVPTPPDGIQFSSDDIWDLARLMKEISALPTDQIKRIHALLEMEVQTMADARNNLPEHRLPGVPEETDVFVASSRDRDIQFLVEMPDCRKALFISGTGGIGKTQLAIQLAKYFRPRKGTYFIEYVVPEPDAEGKTMEGMKATILKARFANHQRTVGHSDEDDYDKRLGYLQTEFDGALLIIDNFDWPGKTLAQLRNEEAYRDLTATNVQLVFTTRYPIGENSYGKRITSISEDHLVELMRKNCSDQEIKEDELRELIHLVNNHTMAVDLIARTLEAANGLLGPSDIKDALKEQNFGRMELPKIHSDRNGGKGQNCENNTGATLYEHLRMIFSTDALSEEEQEVFCCALLLPDDGLDMRVFAQSLGSMAKNDILNKLREMGWVIKDPQRRIIQVDPLIRIVCRSTVCFSEERCGVFLDNLWEKHGKRGGIPQGHVFQMAACFDNAAHYLNACASAMMYSSHASDLRRESGVMI